MAQFQKGNQAAVGAKHVQQRFVSEIIRRTLKAVDPDDEDGRTRGEVLILSLYRRSLAEGGERAAEILFDRAEGKALGSVELGEGAVLMVVRAPAAPEDTRSWLGQYAPRMIDVTPGRAQATQNGSAPGVDAPPPQKRNGTHR